MGQDFCQLLISKSLCGIDKWEQIMCVGTKKDTYYCGKKSQTEKWTEWQENYLNSWNACEHMEGSEVEHCVLTNICVDDEDDDPTDVSQLVKIVQNFGSELKYRAVSDDEIIKDMNCIFKATVVTKRDLEVARKENPLGNALSTAAVGAAGAGAAVAGGVAVGSAAASGVVMAEGVLAAGAITATGTAAICAAGVAGAVGGAALVYKARNAKGREEISEFTREKTEKLKSIFRSIW